MIGQGNSFGYWLRRRRKALDLTQDALAQKVCCSQAAIKKIEAEERRPSRGLAERLAEQLAIPALERAAFVQAARTLQTTGRLPLDELPVEPLNSTAASQKLAPAGDQKLPFVGRSKEYGQFLGLIARLTAGSGQVLLIEGEAGIGKSRLMAEVACYARQRALPVLLTNCYEIERAIAYQAVIDLATQACQAAPEASLRKITPILLAEIATLVPAMATRMVDLLPLAADFPEARQARLFHALLQLFDALAQDRQLIVMIDDIQWADDASLQFLHFLARQIASRPVLLACAYRDEEAGNNERMASLIERLRREPHARHMALARLGPGDTETLLERMNDPKLSAPGLAARLHVETEGNPFFLWSILHSLSEGGCAVRDTGSLPLPDALRDSVRVRLARVPHEDRPLLDVAAVLGRRFDFETLLALTRAPEERFLHTMESLVKRRLLHEDQESGFYDFSHDKVREVVYRDIGSARRVLLHRAVAEMLEQHPTGNAHERDARLAEHFERGKVWPKALLYLGLAAEHSQQLFAMRETLRWFDRAVALLQAHPEAATQAQQLALYERRGVARAQAGQIEGAVADFRHVIDAARALGEHEHARDVLIQLGMAYRRADAYEQAIVCLDEALKASRAMGDERHAADTLYHLGTVAWSNGRNDLAITYHQEAVDICERLALTDLVAVQAFHGRGEAHFANVEPAAAIVSYSRSLELARGIGDKSYESENLMMIGWACTGHMGLADYRRALSHFNEALAIARAADLQWHLGPTLIGRAHAQVALGQFGTAWADLNEALPRLETLGLVRYQIMAHDALGCLLLDLNQPGQASQHFERGLGLARDAGIMYWRPRLQANLAITQLRLGIACDHAALQAAWQYAQDHGEAWLTLRCLEARAEWSLDNGDAQGCITHADRLLALASRGDLRELVGQAHRLRGLAWLAGKAYPSARKELTLALTLAERIGQIRLAWECHRALARVAAALGDAVGKSGSDARARALADQMTRNLYGSGLTSNLETDQ
ncbi:MAG: AAA family ATPase [Polaromonas sp.]